MMIEYKSIDKQFKIYVKPSAKFFQSHAYDAGYYELSFGINGHLEWKELGCVTRTQEKTTKIRPVLNTGSSPDPTKEATA